MKTLLRQLSQDQRGGAIVEFGLLAPLFILMFIAVLQTGMALQAYNSVRRVSAETARDVSVQYQTGNRLTTGQIAQLSTSKATGSPYLLRPNSLEITVEDAVTQRIPKAKEMTLEIQYTVPTFLDFAGIEGPQLEYSRPIFVSLS